MTELIACWAFATCAIARAHLGSAVLLLFVALAALVSQPSSARGQAFTDPGFENYSVASGQFVRPAAGGVWAFVNDASVVEPFAGNSSTGPLNTWSATFAAVDGQQYACTYAGTDSIRQSVAFASAGQYEISVYAAAPDGTLTIPGVFTSNVVDGEFTFTLGNTFIGATHSVDAGASWSQFAATFDIPAPGNYQLGIRNTLSAVYFVNYDGFAIHSVPEPSTLALGLAGVLLLAAGLCRRRR